MDKQSKNQDSMFHDLNLEQFRLFCDINKVKEKDYMLTVYKIPGGWMLTAPSDTRSARLMLSNKFELRVFKSLDTVHKLIESELGGLHLKVYSFPKLK
ncbi:hypothetical protein [Acinetobacter baumannii]|uniref:hypothetical protein n=1 Tax=Acinetobacter baumannii TaxID=470 RepID=UPI000BF79506|nr:hypothetical protein [Acinetobacter baumannii]